MLSSPVPAGVRQQSFHIPQLKSASLIPDPPPVSEPRSRISAVSSGFSVRRLPPPSVEQIRKSCAHYQAKAKTNSGRAVRYLGDLIGEVTAQLDTVDVQSARFRERNDHLERMMAEWQDIFGKPQPALGAAAAAGGDDAADSGDGMPPPRLVVSTPRQLADQLAEQASTIAVLRAEAARAEEQRAAAAEEAQQLLEQNKDVARRALRAEVARMEAQRTAALRQQQLEHAADVEALQREHGREYERLGSVHAAEARLLVERYEGRIAAVQQSCSKSRAVTQAELQAVEERCRRDAAAAQMRALEEAAGREAGLRAQLSCAQSQSEKVVQGVAHAHHRELQQLRRRLEVRRKAAARPRPAPLPLLTPPSLALRPRLRASRCPTMHMLPTCRVVRILRCSAQRRTMRAWHGVLLSSSSCSLPCRAHCRPRARVHHRHRRRHRRNGSDASS